MSQEDLAARAGVRSATVSRYERGQFQPRADKLAPIAEALGTSIDWLFRGVSSAATEQQNALRAFLASPDGSDVTDDERAELASFRPSDDNVPSVSFYGALLLLIRSGMKRSLEERPSRGHETSGVRETAAPRRDRIAR